MSIVAHQDWQFNLEMLRVKSQEWHIKSDMSRLTYQEGISVQLIKTNLSRMVSLMKQEKVKSDASIVKNETPAWHVRIYTMIMHTWFAKSDPSREKNKEKLVKVQC